jgi:hypothetical protein
MNTTIWQSLPETVRRGILVGSEGKLHLMHLAQEMLLAVQSRQGAAQKLCLDMGIDMLRAAWSKDPLDGQLAGQLLALDEKWPRLDQGTRALVREVASRWRQPEDLRYYKRLAESRDMEKLRRFLLTQMGKEGDNLYWWQQAVSLGMYEQDQELLNNVLRRDWRGLEPCRKLLAGDMAWLRGERDAACGAYAKAPGFDPVFRRARHFFDAGRVEEAKALWRDAFETAPWLTSEMLAVFDLLHETGGRTERLPDQVAICLYSFNKAGELDATLESLFASDIGEKPVWVLDNGSPDATSSVLDAWQERAGARLHRIGLHINIGAPAARNWLMHVPEIQACDWMVFLDDDVEVPADWLGRLGAAAAAYPDAGVWGCKVVGHDRLCVMQSADLHLVPPVSEDDIQAQRRFKVSDLHHQTLDYGQFDYMRPCASVTGCCHLFRMDRLQESGGFDLRFSPSQFDDLEHDIRLNLAGQHSVYQGFLNIRHKKRTGKSSRTSTPEFGNSLANMHKLQMKYSAAQYEELMAWEAGVLAKDYMRKRDAVMRRLSGRDR